MYMFWYLHLPKLLVHRHHSLIISAPPLSLSRCAIAWHVTANRWPSDNQTVQRSTKLARR